MELMTEKLSKSDKIKMIEEMLKSYENLPPHAMTLPINHYDYCSLLMLLLSLFKEDS